MIRIYLVRHAIAIEATGSKGPDGSRPLTGKGRRRFRRTARALARLGESIDAIFTSPLVRAVQTAEILSDALGGDEVEVLEELLPEVAPGAALLALAKRIKDGSGVALVGHDPQMSALVAALGHLDAKRAAEVEFKKGAVVRIDVGSLPLAKKAEPRWWLPPKGRDKKKGLPLGGSRPAAVVPGKKGAARQARPAAKAARRKPAAAKKAAPRKAEPAPRKAEPAPHKAKPAPHKAKPARRRAAPAAGKAQAARRAPSSGLAAGSTGPALGRASPPPAEVQTLQTFPRRGPPPPPPDAPAPSAPVEGGAAPEPPDSETP